MCFSATASFAASGVLGCIGALAYNQVRHKRQYLFALIPSLFAVQQAAEGVVWLSFTHSAFEPWRTTAMYTFLFFALIIWPVWVPLSALCLDGARRSRLLDIALVVGIFVSLYLAVGSLCHEISVASVRLSYTLFFTAGNVQCIH